MIAVAPAVAVMPELEPDRVDDYHEMMNKCLCLPRLQRAHTCAAPWGVRA